MSAIRLDTLRNQLVATTDLLRMIRDELEDLHVLAYERHVNPDEAKVSGGSRDYALDTHGDPKARDAYRTLGNVTSEACNDLAQASHEALALLRVGNTAHTGRRRIQLVDLGESIAAQQRRIAAGDYVPYRRGPQPERDQAVAAMEKKLKTLGRERDSLSKLVDRLNRKLGEKPKRRRRRDERGPATARQDRGHPPRSRDARAVLPGSSG